MARGRPSKFNPELAERICSLLAEGWTLRQVCRQEGMPSHSTVISWVLDDKQGFSNQYAQARETGYQVMADELVEISDDGTNDWIEREGKEDTLNGEHVQRSRLRVDTRKWLLSKALPKIYGDKTSIEHTGADGGPIEMTDNRDLARAVMDIFRQAEIDGETGQTVN